MFECAANNNNVDEVEAAKRREETGSPTLLNQKETQDSLDTVSVIPGLSGSENGLVFSTKYEDPGTNVVANVASVADLDLKEKVTLSWKNINVFVPQPKASICRRLCCGEKDDQPKTKQILSDGKC